MFDWLGDIISGMGDAIGSAFDGISDKIIDGILNRIIQWLFTVIYDGISEFFTMISSMGVEIFSLDWVNAVVKLFSLFGWTLFVVGVAVSACNRVSERQSKYSEYRIKLDKRLYGCFAFHRNADRIV